MIKYAKYMQHNGIGSMSTKFDRSRARLDITSLLFKHREIKKGNKDVRVIVEMQFEIVIDGNIECILDGSLYYIRTNSLEF